ncbi:MAG TPA: helix-turn-helix domain-containing protein [Bryobacteraceae bacterium]|nr:helix-turn-helix domain-containing protein [Bryobacteraceae bacterium]
MSTDEKMLSVKEAGGRLGVGRDSVKRLIVRGKLGAIRFPAMGGRGMNIRYGVPESEINRFLDQNRTGRGR